MKTQIFTHARNLRLLIALAALFIFSVSSVYAQGNGMGRGGATPEERAKRQTERMKEELKLTPAQEPKAEAINLKYAKKVEDVRKITDTAVQRKSLLELNKQKTAELKAVLTPDQLKTYQKIMQEMMEKRRQGLH